MATPCEERHTTARSGADDVASPRSMLPTDDVTSLGTDSPNDDVTLPITTLPADDVTLSGPALPTDDVILPGTSLPTNDITSLGIASPADDATSSGIVVPTDDVTSPEAVVPTDEVTPSGTTLPDDDVIKSTSASDLQLSTHDDEPINQPCTLRGRDIQGGAELLNLGEVLRSQLQDSETSFVQANSQVVADGERSRCVQTDDLEEASDILQETGRVILCGFPGTGKTTVGHALLRRCREEGFKPYILSKLEDWHAHIGPGRRSFVLIDDLMGVVRLNRQQYEEWRKILRNMLELIKAGDCRVVVTLYPHVLHELQQLETDSQSPLLDSSAVVRLMKEDLDTEVKRKLLDFHLKQLPLQPSQQQELVERIVQADTSGPAFLWCCRYLVDHWQAVEDPATVFTSPTEAYSVLLKQMCLHKTHGDSFAAVFVLTMLGKGRFLHNKVRAQAELLEHGFQGHCDDHLAEYENILLGSVLASQDRGFISRVMYDAAGLALGRSFRLPTLLRVCDVTFLVQYVHVKVTDRHLNKTEVLMIQVGSGSFVSVPYQNNSDLKSCQSLMERLYEEVTKGNLNEISQQPALQCRTFLTKMEEYCENEKHNKNQLVQTLDSVDSLPLIYWSASNKCHILSEWCMIKMETDQVLQVKLNETLLACFLFSHLIHESAHKAEQVLFPGLLSSKNGQFSTDKVVLSLEYVAKHSAKTSSVHETISGAKKTERQLHYLVDTSIPIPSTLAKLEVSEQVAVQVGDRGDWYLVLRLLADREVDETDRDGNTLLHIAADKGNLEAIRLVVKSGASLTKTNNKGLTPYKLAQRRLHKCRKVTDEDETSSEFFCAIRDGSEFIVKVLLCYGRSAHDKDLSVACEHGHGNIANLFIHLGANVHGEIPVGLGNRRTPLHLACCSCLTQTAELIIKHHADVDAETDNGETALHFACSCHTPTASADMTRLLLDAGADVNARDENGDTPLVYALRRGHEQTLTMLIDHGADVNARDDCGNTPLHLASRLGQDEIVPMLIDRGADLNAVDKYNRTPLHNAYTEKKVHVIHQLIDAGVKTSRVHQAVVRGNVDALRTLLNVDPWPWVTLLKRGADVNQHDTSMGCSPLHAACLIGSTDIVTCLTQYRAEVNAADCMKRTPLHCACQTGATKIVTCLIKKGAQVNVVDDTESTPLHYACAAGHTQVARQLIDKEADVNARDERLATPLHRAAAKGNVEVMLCLIEHGACVNTGDISGTTPLHESCEEGHTEISLCLIEHGACVIAQRDPLGHSPLLVACEMGHTDTARCLMEQGANVNATADNDVTPLHTACENGHTQTAQCLLQHGANVNAVSEKYGTPLHKACENGHTQSAQCILQHGADVNAISLYVTPLHSACRNGHTETVECLLQHGANVNAVSKLYGTPLDMARQFFQHDVVTLLVQRGAVSRYQITRTA